MMLPSTGHFKAINCPFFDSGLCERPYCHYKHVKKDTSGSLDTNGEILQQLVSEALKKVLKQKEVLPDTPLEIPTETIVSEVIDTLTPKTEVPDGINTDVKALISTVPSYKPTPIAELKKKRHIPVPYTPRISSTASRKSKAVSKSNDGMPPTKRVKLEETRSPKPSTSEYNPDVDTEKCVGYSPACTSKNSSSLHSYIPSSIASLKAPLDDYVPLGTGDENATYQPSNSMQQEPEYRPISDTQTATEGSYIPTDKAMLEGLDLTTEFDLLDEIINEHTLSMNNIKNSLADCEQANGNSIQSSSTPSHYASDKDALFDSLRNGTSAKADNDDINNSKMNDLSSAEKEVKVLSHRSSSHHKSRSKTSSKSGKHKDKHKDKSSSADLKSKDSSKHQTSKSSSSTNSTSSKRKSESSSSSTSKSHKSHRSKSSHKSKRCLSTSKNKDEQSKTKLEDDILLIGTTKYDRYSDNDADNVHSEQSESDQEEIAKECFRIFQEYEPSATDSLKLKPRCTMAELADTRASGVIQSSLSKQRIAREGFHTKLSKSAAPPLKKHVLNPSQAMVQRYRSNIQTIVEPKYCESNDKPLEVKSKSTSEHRDVFAKMKMMRDVGFIEKSTRDSSSAPSSSQAGKLRIAHVPNVSSLLEAKSRVNTAVENRKKRELMVKKHESHVIKKATIAQTSKAVGGQRVAHIPVSTPAIATTTYADDIQMHFPIVTRQKYINALVKEFTAVMSPEQALERALVEEDKICRRVTRKTMHNSAVTASILQFRREYGLKKTLNRLDSIQHSKVLEGNIKGSWSVKKKALVVEDDSNMYHLLERYILTKDELELNGFPLLHPTIKGMAVAKPMFEKELPFSGNSRTCIRCRKHYSINREGLQISNEKCVYHAGKVFKSQYLCCKEDINSTGCASHDCHIFSTFKLNNTGFLKTLPCVDIPGDGDYGVYALDCEMVFTTKGIELARITVVDRNLETVMDSFVMPPNPILDYATSFSGITAELLDGVSTTLTQVQAALLGMVNDKTILIGHSLDSDLRVMKIVHETVVDTSVVFPHKRGFPFKKGLRNLSATVLDLVIQQQEGGHDSAEDAIASLKLMIHKVKEDLKLM